MHRSQVIRRFYSLARLISKENKEGWNKIFKGTDPSKQLRKNYLSRYTGSTIMPQKTEFRFSDYDCVGFDLDNTVCHYNLTNMVKLEYSVLADYLIKEKGYSPLLLSTPLEQNVDFLQKGLVMDFERGNILRLGPGGYIQRACHGTKLMSDDEVIAIYGKTRSWDVATQFSQDMLVAWNGPLSERLRTLLDYFDMPSSLIFGKIVDTIDMTGGARQPYKFWPDVLEGLINMYCRDHFASNKGGYFPEIKRSPEQYIRKTSPQVISWLKKLKQEKTTFLITGSNADFANFTASYALGSDWHELFDHIIFYARKPGFFTGFRPFLGIKNFTETTQLDTNNLQMGKFYSQGNWKGLMEILTKSSGKITPKVLYIGDNLIQDIYTPSTYSKCDTVAISEEMLAEGMTDYSKNHEDCKLLVSSTWGSYFGNVSQKTLEPTFWSEVIRKHAKICIPNLNHIADKPLDTPYTSFDGDQMLEGFFPAKPKSITVDL